MSYVVKNIFAKKKTLINFAPIKKIASKDGTPLRNGISRSSFKIKKINK
jgi:hypothetical protein